MSTFFDAVKEMFFPKQDTVVQKPPHSCLSKPWIHEGLNQCHINVLMLIGNQNGVRACELDRIYNSWGRRANDLLHMGYVDNIGKKACMKYVLNDKGIELLK